MAARKGRRASWLSAVRHDPPRDHGIMVQPAQPAKCDHVIGGQYDGGIGRLHRVLVALPPLQSMGGLGPREGEEALAAPPVRGCWLSRYAWVKSFRLPPCAADSHLVPRARRYDLISTFLASRGARLMQIAADGTTLPEAERLNQHIGTLLFIIKEDLDIPTCLCCLRASGSF